MFRARLAPITPRPTTPILYFIHRSRFLLPLSARATNPLRGSQRRDDDTTRRRFYFRKPDHLRRVVVSSCRRPPPRSGIVSAGGATIRPGHSPQVGGCPTRYSISPARGTTSQPACPCQSAGLTVAGSR